MKRTECSRKRNISTTGVVFAATVGRITFVDACLTLCDYRMFSNLISPLWAVKALLRLCVYNSGTMIGCWIMVGTVDLYLGRAARRRACIHGRSHALLSRPAISNLCPAFSLRPIDICIESFSIRSTIKVYPNAIPAHPSNPSQLALGLSDSGVYVIVPLESDKEWRSDPLSETVDNSYADVGYAYKKTNTKG
ncbi:hypothetical protein Tco_1005286 [Tanacetum coccineum]|uniref:Uncharacterized protein n=1 Tax=Tanacetum coccineum TaxID=301880 RepID=A0ABQ5FEU2_9ASTR